MQLAPRSLLDNRFEVESLVAMGGQSIVYRGRDLNTGRQVAIKLMQDVDGMEGAETRRQFEREFEVLRDGGTGLPRGLALLEFGGRPVVVEDWLDGKTMDTEGTRLDCRHAARRAIAVLRILQELHERRPPVVVRDVKPRNLLVRGDDVWLVDLSASHLMHGKRDTVELGTLGFAAPEQFGGHSEPRSDLFSVGVLLHHLMTGEDASDMSRLPCKPRSVRADVSPALDAVVRRATELDPTARFRDAAEMIEAIEHALRAPAVAPPSLQLPPLLVQVGAADPIAAVLQVALSLMLGLIFLEAFARIVLLPTHAGSGPWFLAMFLGPTIPWLAGAAMRRLGVVPLARVLTLGIWSFLAFTACGLLESHTWNTYGPWSEPICWFPLFAVGLVPLWWVGRTP